eukprot:6187667-Pleurochrysis_carterae.AAC.1
MSESFRIDKATQEGNVFEFQLLTYDIISVPLSIYVLSGDLVRSHAAVEPEIALDVTLQGLIPCVPAGADSSRR